MRPSWPWCAAASSRWTCLEPFPAWHLLSKKLADDLDATAVDDQGQPLTLHAFDAIGREIDDLYQRLERLDLAAGSPAARRLFS
jgi:hypothetical protein